MKSSILLLGMLMNFSTTAQAQPMIVDSPVDRIFVPSGFDDNDNVELVLHGRFPTPCYSVGDASVQVDHAQRIIRIEANSHYNPDEVCIRTVTPFIQTVAVGQLEKGSYELIYASKPSITNELTVAARKTESPDDYLFAPVDSASIAVNPESGKQALKLEGHFPYYLVGCMVIREVRVVKNPADVLMVRPIAELINDEETCAAQRADHSYSYTVGLPETVQSEDLLHVRTLHGTSLNRLIEIP